MTYQNFLYEEYNRELDLYFINLNESLFNAEDFMLKISKIVSTITSTDKLISFINSTVSKINKWVKSNKAKFRFFAVLFAIVLGSNVFELQKIENGIIDEVFGKYVGEQISSTRTFFLQKLAFKESSNVWDTVNGGGYMGLFQFGERALRDIGITDITTRKFKEDPNIFPIQAQVTAINKLIDKNLYYLRNYMDYEGKIIKGVKITKSGMVAAAHLVGAKSVKRFLTSNGKIDRKDGNGKACSVYMKEFSGFKI